MRVRLTSVAATAVLIYGCVSVNAPLSPSATPAGTSPASLEPGTSASPLPTIGPASLLPTAQATDPAMTTAPTTPEPGATVAPATPTATPTAPATPRPPRIRSFEYPRNLDCNVDPEPSTVHLEWNIARGSGVTISIDGPGVYDSYDGRIGSADVPFSCSEPRHTYLLTTVGGDGPADTQEVTIRRARPRVISFDLIEDCEAPDERVFEWEVDNAMSVEISIDNSMFGSYMMREGQAALPFDCSVASEITYTLETIATYGPQATRELLLTQGP